MARSIDHRGGPGPTGDWANWQPKPRTDSEGADISRRRLLQWMLGLGGIAAFGELVYSFQALSNLGTLRTERPATTQVISQLTVNLSKLNLRTTPSIPLEQEGDNTIDLSLVDAVGRIRGGNGQQLHSFSKEQATVTLENVPLVSNGYNPDTPMRKNGLWAAIPVELDQAIFWPALGITHKKGWAYFSISSETSEAVAIPDNAFPTVNMSPADPKTAVVK